MKSVALLSKLGCWRATQDKISEPADGQLEMARDKEGEADNVEAVQSDGVDVPESPNVSPVVDSRLGVFRHEERAEHCAEVIDSVDPDVSEMPSAEILEDKKKRVTGLFAAVPMEIWAIVIRYLNPGMVNATGLISCGKWHTIGLMTRDAPRVPLRRESRTVIPRIWNPMALALVSKPLHRCMVHEIVACTTFAAGFEASQDPEKPVIWNIWYPYPMLKKTDKQRSVKRSWQDPERCPIVESRVIRGIPWPYGPMGSRAPRMVPATGGRIRMLYGLVLMGDDLDALSNSNTAILPKAMHSLVKDMRVPIEVFVRMCSHGHRRNSFTNLRTLRIQTPPQNVRAENEAWKCILKRSILHHPPDAMERRAWTEALSRLLVHYPSIRTVMIERLNLHVEIPKGCKEFTMRMATNSWSWFLDQTKYDVWREASFDQIRRTRDNSNCEVKAIKSTNMFNGSSK